MENQPKEIIWTNRSVKDLRKVYNFNKDLHGEEKSFELIQQIIVRIEFLTDRTFTEMGLLDNDFAHLKRDYRKLIEGYHKISYRESKDKSKIYVNRIFDTRQHPSKNK